MAVRSFATNNLVADHDLYVKFMKKRWAYISEEGGEPTEVLFCKKGIVSDILDLKFDEKNQNKSTAKMCVAMNSIKKWHSIGIAYDIWCEYAKFYVDKVDHNRIPFKKFVDMPEDILKKFKFRFEQSVKNAKCQYTKYGKALVDPCRLLAMFWTYLELVNDEKTQRYFPNHATTERAAKVFGYNKDEDPFKLNGTFMRSAICKKKVKPMEEKKVISKACLDTLLVDIIDDRRLTNPLTRAGIQTVRDFCNKTDKELLNVRTFGVSKLRHVKEIISENVKTIEQPEESVIDIAEQAAAEVEAERIAADIPNPPLRDLREAFNKLKETDDALIKKYDELLKNSKELARQNDELLRNKMDLERYCSRLRDDNNNLKDEVAGLKARETRLSIAADPNNRDALTLLTTVLNKMAESKMDNLFITINGMTVDIHKKQNAPFGKADSYKIRSSEV